MLVIMALVTTFMTSPLLEWTYPKKLIKLDMVSHLKKETGLNTATYRFCAGGKRVRKRIAAIGSSDRW